VALHSSAARIRADIIRTAHSGLDSVTLRRQVAAKLRRVVPMGSYGFATVDPATVMFTSTVGEHIPGDALPRLAANEYAEEDFNKFSELAISGHVVGRLNHVTGGRPSRSRRYREILRPLGWGDELRVVFVSGGLCWGFICMHRERSRADFTADEAAFLAGLAPHIAEGLRKSLLIPPASRPPSDLPGPGVLELTDTMEVAAINDAARVWLADMAEGDSLAEGGLPPALFAAVARLRAIEAADDPVALPQPRLRVRTRSGDWLLLHASRLHRPHSAPRAVVIIERLEDLELAPFISQMLGLTQREGEVCQLVVRGLATTDISTCLRISAHTVQDHLKRIFDKAGVRSRRELVGQLFIQHYWPLNNASSRVGKIPNTKG
jgi:DNA-binding CsgD family transcriptional regulator